MLAMNCELRGSRALPGLVEFCEKADLRLMNKRVLESADGEGQCARQLRQSAPKSLRRWSWRMVERAEVAVATRRLGFAVVCSASSTQVPAVDPGEGSGAAGGSGLVEHTRLQNEKDVLGFFVSGHPMDKYRRKLRNMKVVDTVTACEMKPEPQVFRRGQPDQVHEIAIAGVITGLKVAKSKVSGELYAQASLEGADGKIELIAFSRPCAEKPGEG